MKTYILRKTQTVQPQTRTKRRATAGAVLEPTVARAARGPALFIGLDVHTASIAVSLAPVIRRKCAVTG